MQCRDRKSTLLDRSTQLIGRLYPVSKRETEAELKERSLLLYFYIQFGVYFDVGIIQSCYRLIWFSRDTRLKVVKIVATSCLSYCVILIPGKYNYWTFGVYIGLMIIQSCYRCIYMKSPLIHVGLPMISWWIFNKHSTTCNGCTSLLSIMRWENYVC